MKNKILFLLIGLLALGGCGDGNTAPDGATITISPATFSWKTAKLNPLPSPCYMEYRLVPVSITLRNARGRVIPGVDIDLSLVLAQGTSSSTVVELYDGYINDQQIADGSAVEMLLPTRVTTNDAGVKELTVLMWVGCNNVYRAVLTANSGSASTFADFEHTAVAQQ